MYMKQKGDKTGHDINKHVCQHDTVCLIESIISPGTWNICTMDNNQKEGKIVQEMQSYIKTC